jgi:hypothetical protein
MYTPTRWGRRPLLVGGEVKPMSWPFGIYNLINPERYIWAQIRILHETDKAILIIYNGIKIWIPKSRIFGIRLRNSVFEIYAKEEIVG